MQQITTIGLDLAKQVFQVHGAEADGSVGFLQKAVTVPSRHGGLRRDALLGA
jgi:hypothetical protein